MNANPVAGLLITLLSTTASAQTPAQLVKDLGDPARREAAGLALVQLGSKAVPALAAMLADFSGRGPAEEQRLRAALQVIEGLGPDAAELQPELDRMCADRGTVALIDVVWARGSLAPYSGANDWSQAFHLSSSRQGEDKARLLTGFQRHAARLGVRVDESDERLLQRLRDNVLFEREVAAELLGRHGCKAAFAVLRERLLDRQTQPKGWDGLKHNGVVVPMQDAFRLRAAEAMLRLGPEDPGIAVALGCEALLHPFLSVRQEALQRLGGLGPLAQDAVPELLAVAQGSDAGLAIAALKVIGMSATRAEECLAVAERLAAAGEGEVSQRAKSLAAQLHAMKVELPPPPPVEADRFAGLVADLGIAAKEPAAVTALRAAGAAALSTLQARLLADGDKAPEALVRLCGELARGLPQEDRVALGRVVMGRFGDNWEGPSFGMSSGGGECREVDREVYADLQVGAAGSVTDLAGFLDNDNPYLRWQAARRLAERAAEAAKDPAVVKALLAAMRSEQPRQARFPMGMHGTTNVTCNLDARIHAAAVAALALAEVEGEDRALLLYLTLDSDDVDAVVAAIARWGGVDTVAELGSALGNRRAAVAIAAAEALGKLGKQAAAATRELQRAAADKDAAVAAAAGAALAKVQGQ